jgi:RNA polymerase sigma factor (sigma-70 family)
VRSLTGDTAPPPAVTETAADDARVNRAERLAVYLRQAQGGDVEALDPVVRELNPLLWHVARSQGLATEDAIDVVQTTWLELLKRLQEIRSPQALTMWLISTTRRGAWRAAIRRRREVASETDEMLGQVPDSTPDIDDRLDADARHRALWRHLQRLPERCRELLRIVAMVDRPDYDDVAAALGMPRGSIGPTRGRCLSKLRALLTADPSWST